MKHIRPASAVLSAQTTSFCKIVEEQTRRKSSKFLKAEKARTGNKLVRLKSSKPKNEDNCVSIYGPTPHFPCKNYKVGPNET